jgi:hypothetical protein
MFSLFRNSDRLAGTFHRRRSGLLKTSFFRQVRELKIQRKNPGSALWKGLHLFSWSTCNCFSTSSYLSLSILPMPPPLAYNRHLHLRRSIVQISMLHYSIQWKITKDIDVTKHLNFLPSPITFTKERSSQSFVKVMGCWLHISSKSLEFNIITKQQCICKTYNVI